MAALIDDLLDMSQVSSNVEMEMEEQPLQPILENAVATLQTQITQKSQNLSLSLGNQLYIINCNPNRLHQVFANLVGNASKYTPEGGNITVKLTPQGETILFQVTDTGYGIPEADQPHIFDRFYRAKSEDTVKISGTGLGLAITKFVVEKHGGQIWVESIPQQGSTFFFYLPLLDAVDEDDYESVQISGN